MYKHHKVILLSHSKYFLKVASTVSQLRWLRLNNLMQERTLTFLSSSWHIFFWNYLEYGFHRQKCTIRESYIKKTHLPSQMIFVFLFIDLLILKQMICYCKLMVCECGCVWHDSFPLKLESSLEGIWECSLHPINSKWFYSLDYCFCRI